LDVESEERALELAKSYPALRYGTGEGGLEVWPLMDQGNADA
ncbi:MAG: hypothetical protein JWN96_4650, partial [Mycobacterium sp.]|nr:hypothetical protein [Mycobacterium sp.]